MQHGVHFLFTVPLIGLRVFTCFKKGFPPTIHFRKVFLRKAIIGFALPNVLLKVLLMFCMCQCLLMTSLAFHSEGLYVTEKEIIVFSYCKESVFLSVAYLTAANLA